MSRTEWLPLESNPEVMNKFVYDTGVPKSVGFFDIFSTDAELLCMVPQPCYAVLLLFPPATQAKFNEAQAEKIATDGQEMSSNLFYLKQTIGNACGTIGLIHAVANSAASGCFDLEEGYLKEFIESSKELSPEDRGAKLEQSDGIAVAHDESAQEGQTEAPELESKVNLHFIAFVERDGCLHGEPTVEAVHEVSRLELTEIVLPVMQSHMHATCKTASYLKRDRRHFAGMQATRVAQPWP